MTLLHDFFDKRNLQAFQRLLDGNSNRKQSGNTAGPSTSGGKSWNRPSALASFTSKVDVNARDQLGRTVLHLSSNSPEFIEYVRALLRHPGINVNLSDTESHWTALHRALYNANLPAALLLLQRSDIDTSLKDSEGYTAFDLYNSTLNGTKPEPGDVRTELFTWGANRNAALGLGDGDDRANPDQVVIQSKEDPGELEQKSLATRFSPIYVRHVQMSRLHTAVVTSESAGNLRVCGFGSGGRLGPGQHTQYSLKALPQFTHTIVSVALGQDHTLALTKSGEVLSWGLNRFSQLGYVVETTTGKHDEPTQSIPKKIYGPLRKEVVYGIAASKGASACWTSEEVYTWGTNNGQLGYDKVAQPAQILPRKVIKFTQPVIAMTLTDNAMACLLRTQQVECIWNDRHYRINFPIHGFPSEIQPYRPPQAVKDSHIAKITSCDEVFAALSSNGEVFTFTPPNISSDHANMEGSGSGREVARAAFKPQRVWALRKKFSAVNDVALGSDGSIIICTESGHVYVRTRNAKSAGKTFKFQRIPYLQRVAQVCANSTGAFGALRVDFKPKPIVVHGNGIAEDLAGVEPFLLPFGVDRNKGAPPRTTRSSSPPPSGELRESSSYTQNLDFAADEEQDDVGIERDIRRLMEVLKRERGCQGGSVKYGGMRLPQGADTLIHVAGLTFPAHRVILAARSIVLRDILAGLGEAVDKESASNAKVWLLPSQPGPGLGVLKLTMLALKGVQPYSVLIFLHYLYSDDLLAIWDRRVHTALVMQAGSIKVNVALVKADLQTLARLLELPRLAYALEPPVKRLPVPSMVQDMRQLFADTREPSEATVLLPSPDILLELAEHTICSYSAILRGRSDFFASLFGEECWTIKRWSGDGVLKIDLKHLRLHVMEYVLRFLVCGEDAEMFETLPFVKSIDDVLEFMFEVLAAANELLLDRLVLLCSEVILAHLHIHNACYILSEATHYNALRLVESVQGYMVANMESLLETRMLEDLAYALIKQLAVFVRTRQTEKSSFTRSSAYIDALLAKYAGSQSEPTIQIGETKSLKDVSRLEHSPPSSSEEPTKWSTIASTSPRLQAVPLPPSADDIFAMDETDVASTVVMTPLVPASTLVSPVPNNPQSSSPVWKVASNPRVDMKAVIAEAQTSRQTSTPNTSKYIPKIPQAEGRRTETIPFPSSSPSRPSTRPPGSPWRVVSESHATQPQPPPPSSQAPTPQVGGLSKSRPHATASPLRPQPTQSSSSPGLGPVITPTKQPAPNSANSIRSVSGGKAWRLPPPQPIVTTASQPAAGASFVAIQHSQQEQLLDPAKDKRSLREIQDEEQARQAESDFLKWWEAEEERIKQEAAALEEYQRNASNSPRKHPRQKGRPPAKAKVKTDGPPQASNADNSPLAESSNRQEASYAKRKPRKPTQKSDAAA